MSSPQLYNCCMARSLHSPVFSDSSYDSLSYNDKAYYFHTILRPWSQGKSKIKAVEWTHSEHCRWSPAWGLCLMESFLDGSLALLLPFTHNERWLPQTDVAPVRSLVIFWWDHMIMFSFSSSKDWTQGFAHSRNVLCHLGGFITETQECSNIAP
jgi:hypothetical protein